MSHRRFLNPQTDEDYEVFLDEQQYQDHMKQFPDHEELYVSVPTQRFLNKDTGEEINIKIKVGMIPQYLIDNPNLEHALTTMNFVDPTNIGVARPPADFQKYVLGKVREMPGANKDTIEKRWKIPREI